MRFSRAAGAALPILLAGVAACSSSSSSATSSASAAAKSDTTQQITMYTSVTQNTVTAVVAGFAKADPGVKVSVFRATTGQLNARIAADQHSGGLRADVIWGTDPLSMESYAQQNLFRPWPLPSLTGVPAADKTTYFWGTRELYLVIVAHKGLSPMPATWSDLTSAAYRGQVAIPDPASAGSAFAALGYFATEPGFGLNYYQDLKANGAVQVSTVPEVVTDVAEGRYQLGITLDSEVRSAIAAGSPVVLDWPADGAISLYSPIAETVAATGGADRRDPGLHALRPVPGRADADREDRLAARAARHRRPGAPGRRHRGLPQQLDRPVRPPAADSAAVPGHLRILSLRIPSLSSRGLTSRGLSPVRAATAGAAVLTAGLIVALVAVPLWSLGRIAAAAGLTGIARDLNAPGSRVAIVHTVAVAGAVTVLAVTAGTALALAVERRPARSRLLPRLLVAAPLAIPEFVLGFAWSQAYGPAGLSDRLTGLTMPGLFGRPASSPC